MTGAESVMEALPERLVIVGRALAQRCRNENNWYFGHLHTPFGDHQLQAKDWLWRLGYAAKAAICVLLGLQRNLWASIDPDTITVAAWDFHGWSSMDFMGQAVDWTDLVVAKGWRHWSFDTYRNSSV